MIVKNRVAVTSRLLARSSLTGSAKSRLTNADKVLRECSFCYAS